METFAFGLLLIAAITHASWNAIAKSAKGNSITFVWAYLTLSAILFLPVTIPFLYEQGIPDDPWLIIIPLVSGVLHSLYLASLQTAYSKGDLGVVYPTARGVGPLLTMIVALGFLGERPQPIALVGALVVMGGIFVVATGTKGARNWLSLGVVWGAITGVTISAYTLWDNRAVTVWDLDLVPFFALSLTTQAIILAPFALRHRKLHLRQNWWRIPAVGTLWPLGYILVLTAQQTTPISIVAPVREISIVFGAFIGWLIYKEPRPLRRIIGAGVVLLGIVLLTR